jgi:diguanylate cyclase (GGDEF)-like protein
MQGKNNNKKDIVQCNTDHLTKINNRKKFESTVSEIINSSKNYDKSLFIIIDLDDFSGINYSYGHLTGDQLLIKTAEIITYCLKHNNLRNEDYTYGRLNGDEFGIFIKNIEKYNSYTLLETLNKELDKIELQNKSVDVVFSCSIGVSLYPEHGHLFSELLTSSTIALQHSKQLYLNKFKIFKHDDDDVNNIKEKLYWNNVSHKKINSDWLNVYFQPIAKTNANSEIIEISHYECLLRVKKNEEWISPYEYILACERTGKITQVDFFVINEVFKYISVLNSRDQLKKYKFSINISGLSFSHPSFLQFIIDKKIEYKIKPNSVIFEITETAVIENLEKSLKVIDQINRMGFSFALDDFGIGFSNFNTLKSVNLNYVKIDGSFISDIINSHKDRVIVMAINDAAHALGKKTVAEFVEKKETFELLHSLGVDYVQGYFIDKPKPFNYYFPEENNR